MTPTIEETLGMALDRITQLERELKRHEERTEGMSAAETYMRSKTYIEKNPEVWERIKADARSAARTRTRFSIAKEFEELRSKRWLLVHEDEDYKCNNSYRACLTRFLMVQVPEVAPYVNLRRSKIDRFFPELEAVA